MPLSSPIPGHGVVEHVLLAVEPGELCAAPAQPEPNVALNLAGIEDVHGAIAVDGQEVGEVDQGGDRAQADRGEPVLEPARALAVAHAPDVAAKKEWARAWPVAREVEYHVDGARECAGNGFDLGGLELTEARRREVAGDAVDAEAIGSVGRNRDVEQRIVQAHELGEGRAHRGFRVELDDPLMLVAQAHLPLGAEHPAALDAPDFRLLEHDAGAGDGGAGRSEDALHARPGIGRAANHLDLFRARIDHAEPELVGVRMLPRLHHVGDGKGREIVAGPAHRLHLEPDGGELRRDVVERRIGLQMRLQPGEGEFHALSPAARLGTSKGAKP